MLGGGGRNTPCTLQWPVANFNCLPFLVLDEAENVRAPTADAPGSEPSFQEPYAAGGQTGKHQEDPRKSTEGELGK